MLAERPKCGDKERYRALTRLQELRISPENPALQPGCFFLSGQAPSTEAKPPTVKAVFSE